MNEFTVEDLRTALRECAGQDESVDLDGQIVDATFSELGYDSLALLNTVSHIERSNKIALPDDTVTRVCTPRDLLRLVHEATEQRAPVRGM